MIAAAERGVVDGTPINLGTMERTRVIDAVNEVLRYTGKQADIKSLTHMPTAPLNRLASNKLAEALIGSTPKVTLGAALHKPIHRHSSPTHPHPTPPYFDPLL